MLIALRRAVSELVQEQAASTHRIGRITLPVLILAGTNTQTITWLKPTPSADYEVQIQPDQSIIGSATYTILSKTAAAVQIRTTATLAISAGAQVLVIAWVA